MLLLILTIVGGLLPVFGVVIRYWRRSHVKVNCWFCGLNNRVLLQCRDGWMCKHCEQYNGFKPDGDYNRDIPAQWDTSLNGRFLYVPRPQSLNKFPSNGLCEECNRNQEMKVAQLASFQPINPDNFDHEIENFSYHLERAYRLCPPCEAVLEETLSQKKTHVLDMNLQMTGKNSYRGKYYSSKHGFLKSLSQPTTFGTTTMALSIALSNVLLFSSDSVIIKMFGSLSGGELLPKLSSYPESLLSYVIPGPAVCPEPERMSPPLEESALSSLSKILLVYFDLVQMYMLPLSLSCMILKGVSSCYTGFQSSLYLWLALVGTVLFENITSQNHESVTNLQVFQIVLTILILFFSLKEVYSQKSKLSPIKRLKRDNSTHTKRCSESIIKGLSFSNVNKAPAEVASQSLLQSTLSRPSWQGKSKNDNAMLDSSNHLTLPSRPSSVSSHRTLTSASGLLDNSTVLPSIDALSNLSQEDTRSDASVDSAFSNPDSITLDAADSLNSSYQILPGKKNDRQEGDVQSLIEGLSIGPISGQSRRKSAEFKKKAYAQEQKRSLLTPAKLTNIMNESAASGIWHNTPINQSIFTAETRKQTSRRRPSSPCDSFHSQATINSRGSLRNDLPPASFQPINPAWNCTSASSLNMLSVAVPPCSEASNSGFGSPASPVPTFRVPHNSIPPHHLASNPGFGATIRPVPNSPLSGSGVIYTPYGLFHQIASPYGNPVYMMQPQSPILSNRSPSSSFESQFSPQSFSTSSQKNSNSFYDSDYHSSPQSNRKRMKTKSLLSSSFIESVWQSRFAILYTTLCYILLGSVVYILSNSGVTTSIFNKVMVWKEQVLPSLRS